MTASEMREYLRKEFGIESEAQLMEELKKCSIDIGCFVGPVEGGVR